MMASPPLAAPQVPSGEAVLPPAGVDPSVGQVESPSIKTFWGMQNHYCARRSRLLILAQEWLSV